MRRRGALWVLLHILSRLLLVLQLLLKHRGPKVSTLSPPLDLLVLHSNLIHLPDGS